VRQMKARSGSFVAPSAITRGDSTTKYGLYLYPVFYSIPSALALRVVPGLPVNFPSFIVINNFLEKIYWNILEYSTIQPVQKFHRKYAPPTTTSTRSTIKTTQNIVSFFFPSSWLMFSSFWTYGNWISTLLILFPRVYPPWDLPKERE
jgi:hypothetical protein